MTDKAIEKTMDELITQKILGTDDLSIAQGLAHGVLVTLTTTASEISEDLFEANTNAKEFRTNLERHIEATLQELNVFKKQLKDFDSLCAEIRKQSA